VLTDILHRLQRGLYYLCWRNHGRCLPPGWLRRHSVRLASSRGELLRGHHVRSQDICRHLLHSSHGQAMAALGRLRFCRSGYSHQHRLLLPHCVPMWSPQRWHAVPHSAAFEEMPDTGTVPRRELYSWSNLQRHGPNLCILACGDSASIEITEKRKNDRTLDPDSCSSVSCMKESKFAEQTLTNLP
jgi:hypothetical protein